MASFIACIWTQNSSSALTALCCCWTLNTVEPLSVTAARSRVVSTSAAIFFITNWWMSKSLKVWIMTWKLARSKPGRGRAEMQGSSVPLGRNHVSPSGGPLPSWALRIVLTFPPFTAPLPRCAARVVKEGQCSGRKGPGKGRSPAAARAPLSGPEREGRRLLQRLRPPSGHGTSGDDTARHPGPSAVYGCGSCSLNAPFLDPRGHQRACTGKRPVSRGEAHSAYNSGGDEAPFTSGVCLITRRQTWLLQRPSSLTHPLPSGAWWRAAIKGRGVLIIRGGGSWLVTKLYTSFSKPAYIQCVGGCRRRILACLKLVFFSSLSLFIMDIYVILTQLTIFKPLYLFTFLLTPQSWHNAQIQTSVGGKLLKHSQRYRGRPTNSKYQSFVVL